ncbi:manganese efflux pump [Pseudanabaena sp. 'Roaring Creek']|uniref:manganese efflux pump n=1 Tax=Pseudanabaena sp. 'Roaring Creek' TaxID=1681830 RepID=UPI0006D7C510|nr:manganese efflux pump [Pseudanabaena sp. 'Roaring Creek']
MIFDKFPVILLLAIAANLDNLGVGISYGMQKRYIPTVANLTIALISTVLTFLSMIFGQWLEHVLPIWAANDFGASIIIGVGVWVCWESLNRPSYQMIWRFLRCSLFQVKIKKVFHRHPQNNSLLHESGFENEISASNLNSSVCYAAPIQLWETIFLSISLSLNAIAGGLGASLSGYNPIVTSLAIGIFSYITVALGQKLPKKIFNKSLGKFSQQISGILLILIGIYEIVF